MEIGQVKKMHRRLLTWFEKVGRDLPWRRTNDPYKIVVSEIMLQQTQVDRVMPKYEAFLEKFPNWRSLAKAKQSDVIRMWHGLGYNRRALQLHKLAKVIVGTGFNAGPTKNGFPVRAEDIMQLPGIGPYTAQAVRAFAFKEKDAAPVDTNIERVIKRVFGAYKKDKKGIQELAIQILPKDTWSWNHALMDFGASICTARSPKCEICPLKDICAAYPCEGGEIKKVKQSKFEDSDRMYRGRLISYLRKNSILRRNSLAGVLELRDDERINKIVRSLLKDGMIREERGKIRLA